MNRSQPHRAADRSPRERAREDSPLHLVIHDSARKKRVPFEPVVAGKAGLYVCGMTVQDRPHLGHMRAALSGEILARWLRHLGYEVTYVTNFTDIDDKIIERANQEGVSWKEVAQRNIDLYFEFADRLGIRRADVYPRATEHIGEIVAMIASLVEKGHAYASGGDVYFAVESDPAYGSVSGRKTDELQTGARIEPGEHKRSPLDFALWKAAKEGEPSWKSPWGNGRPGWHIECSAMSTKYLGETLDFHGGGLDLIFPHHENERAQSECATGRPFVHHWVHNGLVTMGGEKMSKSTGHYYPIEQAVEDFPPDVVRFYLLSTHYRSAIEFSKERLGEAQVAYGRIETMVRSAKRALAERPGGSPAPGKAAPAADGPESRLASRLTQIREAFTGAMCDDLNTALAIGGVFDLVRAGNVYMEEAGSAARADALQELLDAFGELGGHLGLFEARDFAGEAEIPEEARKLADEREAARKAKDWSRADALRDRLLEMGVVVEDRAEGPLLRRDSAAPRP